MDAERRVPSFRERSAWANLIITVVVISVYKCQTVLTGPNADPGSALRAFVGTIVVLVTLIVAAHIIIAIRTPQEPKDERDRMIERVAYRNAYIALNAGVWTAVPMVLVWGAVSGALLGATAAGLEGGMTIRTAAIGQVLFMCFAFSECVYLATQVLLYRRSA